MSKFKNTEELEKAYKELEREFTKKSQKLAEVEKTNYVTLLHNEMDNLLNDYAKRKISDLEAKLAESEEEIKAIDEDRQFKAEMWTKFANKCKELEKQLAEKEEILNWQNEIVEGVTQEEELLAQKLKSLGVDCIEDLGKYHNQDKISFAVEQLEKVLKTLEEKQFFKKEDTAYCVHPVQIAEYIDNQIKQLKEGK